MELVRSSGDLLEKKGMHRAARAESVDGACPVHSLQGIPCCIRLRALCPPGACSPALPSALVLLCGSEYIRSGVVLDGLSEQTESLGCHAISLIPGHRPAHAIRSGCTAIPGRPCRTCVTSRRPWPVRRSRTSHCDEPWRRLPARRSPAG